MTKAKISEYDAVASNNTDVNGVNIAENCPPSGMNNMGREIMAALKRFQVGSDSDGVTVGGNLVVSGSSTLATTAISSADINGGTIDGTAIGGASAAAGAFTTLSASGVTTVQAGTVSAPAITTTGDTNTGIFFPAADTIAFAEGGAEAMRIDSTGQVKLATGALQVFGALDTGQISAGVMDWQSATNNTRFLSYGPSGTAGGFSWTSVVGGGSGTQAMTLDASGNLYVGGTTGAFGGSQKGVSAQSGSVITVLYGENDTSLGSTGTVSNHPFAFLTNNTERARIDTSGNLLVGTTSAIASGTSIVNLGTARQVLTLKGDTDGSYTQGIWSATTTGDNLFTYFGTETSLTIRGSISYNRTAGLVAYNTTSDYRAKDISGPITDSGALIDSVPVYMGKMKGATQERPMFIAHEVPAYAHTGEKDAVDADGKPVYQQMDASALIPVMWAEIQSLRKRLAALESN